MRRTILCLGILAVTLGLTVPVASATTSPTKPVRLTVCNGPGANGPQCSSFGNPVAGNGGTTVSYSYSISPVGIAQRVVGQELAIISSSGAKANGKWATVVTVKVPAIKLGSGVIWNSIVFPKAGIGAWRFQFLAETAKGVIVARKTFVVDLYTKVRLATVCAHAKSVKGGVCRALPSYRPPSDVSYSPDYPPSIVDASVGAVAGVDKILVSPTTSCSTLELQPIFDLGDSGPSKTAGGTSLASAVVSIVQSGKLVTEEKWATEANETITEGGSMQPQLGNGS